MFFVLSTNLLTPMSHKSISVLDLSRCQTWILSLILANLTLFIPGAFAQWNSTTCDQQGGYQDGQYWWTTQDVWDPAAGWQQCLYYNSHSNWQIVANLKGASWVGSYPHASYGVGGNQTTGPALNTVLNNSTPLMAAWNATYPRNHAFDFAYDIWLNGTTYEVMIWLDWNATQPAGSVFTNATINGINYNVWEGAGGSGPYCISFVTQSGAMSAATNFNLCGILGWINNLKWNGGPGGYFWQNPTFDTVQLGWEIVNTDSASDTNTMNYFNVYYGTVVSNIPTPTVEQPIWQADFDTTFPNAGGFGFSYRDSNLTPASFTSSTNPTGGVGGSASYECTVNLSSYSANPPSSYSGFGVGVTEQPVPVSLQSPSPSAYRLYMAAKVGGTSAGVTSVPASVDINFFTSTNGQLQQIYDLTATMTLSNTWQSFVFDGSSNLTVATWLTGAQALFNQYYTNIVKMEVQITVPGNPNIATEFDYDNNNTVDIDNIKAVQLIPGLVPLTIVQTNGQTQVVWVDPKTGGTSKLQSATNVAGPYVDVTGATSATASPYTVPSGSQQQFYRAVWVP